MEAIKLTLDDPSRFDAILEECPAEGGDLEVVTKPGATTSGRPAALLTFTVDLGGELRRVQATTTVQNLLMAAAALQGYLEREEQKLLDRSRRGLH